jgi:hypothetical protein
MDPKFDPPPTPVYFQAGASIPQVLISFLYTPPFSSRYSLVINRSSTPPILFPSNPLPFPNPSPNTYHVYTQTPPPLLGTTPNPSSKNNTPLGSFPVPHFVSTKQALPSTWHHGPLHRRNFVRRCMSLFLVSEERVWGR